MVLMEDSCIVSSERINPTSHSWSDIKRYLLQNFEWLDEQLGEYEDDYLIIDCPGELLSSGLRPVTDTI